MTDTMTGSRPRSHLPDEIQHAHPGALHGVFYITGNPGLISYYTKFLATLDARLNADKSPPQRVSIFGRSLAGFELDGARRQSGLFSLQDQIRHVDRSLVSWVEQLRGESKRRPRIIIMGHSVGSYIAMEVLRRHNETARAGNLDFDIVSGVLLFPTVVDIAKSPTGLKANWVAQMSWTPWLTSSLAKALSAALPRTSLNALVKSVTGMPEDAAAVTTAFLQSPTGVEQALHMARDELNEITEDKWRDDIWGAEKQRAKTDLMFYFGQDDHWVANETRDTLLEVRGRTAEGDIDLWKPLMKVDELGISHSFCIEHSEIIANRVADHLLNTLQL